jgi:putative ABC transport system substrate-binding protein
MKVTTGLRITDIVLMTVALFTLTFTQSGEAQQSGKIARIGILRSGSPPDANIEGFRQGLRDLGYIEGQNVVLEYRWADRDERLHELARELVQQKVDVILTGSTPATVAAKEATKTIPIIFGAASDPIGVGLVASLARPGGNITGMSLLAPELWPKRLELLKETVPKLSRVAMLWNRSNPGMAARAKETQDAAHHMGVAVQDRGAKDSQELENIFNVITKDRPDGLLTMLDPFTTLHLKHIVEFAGNHQLPGMYEERRFVQAGGLMSYGPNVANLYRRAATYIDKILKGSKPAELPVEQPMKFELFINLHTAKALGLRIPDSVLFRADDVIK